jgi:trimethylamine--corrinoid protein Co-methyltransferase
MPPSPLLQLPFCPPANPLPPLEVLLPEQLERVHLTSLDILENIGLDFLDDEALNIWQKAGTKVDPAARRVWPDRGLVLEAVAQAPASFTWRARNPAHNVSVGGNTLTFGPSGGMAYVSDLEQGRRPGTLADLENFLKLSQLCPLLHYASWEQVSPQDVPVSLRHLRRLYAAFTLTDKVVLETAHGREITTDCLEMARLVFGDLTDGGPVIGDVINVNSPLRYDGRMLGGLITYARAGQVCLITPFIQAGATSPITIAAALAQQNAEVLAGVALTQLVRPGAPVVYGGFVTPADMRSGGPAFGTPEGAWALLAGGQLARYYGLPYRGSGSLTNAKMPDAQAAYESMWTFWPAILSHANMIMHAVGWLDGGLTASYEKFMLDAEMLAMFSHFLAGFTIDDDTLALEIMAAVGPGGHHLSTSHTAAHCRTEFYQTGLFDRRNYESWLSSGAEDATQRAHRMWREWLEQYQPPPLDRAINDALQSYVNRRERELADKNLYG